jgi:hypothetical protein
MVLQELAVLRVQQVQVELQELTERQVLQELAVLQVQQEQVVLQVLQVLAE